MFGMGTGVAPPPLPPEILDVGCLKSEVRKTFFIEITVFLLLTSCFLFFQDCIAV